MTKTLTLILAAGALGAAVAGCGSSKASGIVLAPSSGATADSQTATASASSTTSTTPTTTTKTPTSGPLAKEPTISAGTGAPPKTLQIKDLVKGTGTAAKAGDTVTVNYVGALYKNGKVFDASWKRKQTFTAQLQSGGIITGWVKGIPGMKVGGRRQLVIPPGEAYGKAGQPPTIPANATLVFDIDLLKVSS